MKNNIIFYKINYLEYYKKILYVIFVINLLINLI